MIEPADHVLVDGERRVFRIDQFADEEFTEESDDAVAEQDADAEASETEADAGGEAPDAEGDEPTNS